MNAYLVRVDWLYIRHGKTPLKQRSSFVVLAADTDEAQAKAKARTVGPESQSRVTAVGSRRLEDGEAFALAGNPMLHLKHDHSKAPDVPPLG